jgi:hypothetical protein
MPSSTDPSNARDSSQVLELRQYALRPRSRDALLSLFDRVFVDAQEDVGLRVIGQFRDLDDPDRFVWLRGFPDVRSRAERLAAFYGGPVWKANCEAANATMIDSDDVLLLRPVDADSGFLLPRTRPAASAVDSSGGVVLATIHLLRHPVDASFLRFFQTRVSSLMAAAGASPLASFQTEYAKNDFPKLPVREGEHAFVWFASFPSVEDLERHHVELRRSISWTSSVEPELARFCKCPRLELRLAPTLRSLLRHVEPAG